MLLLGLRSSMWTVQMSVVRGMGRADWHLGAAALSLTLTVVLVNVALGYGLLAVTAAIVLRSVIMWVPYAWFVHRLTGLTAGQQSRAVAGPGLAALAMAAITAGYVAWLGTSIPAAAALAAAVLLGATVYYALLPLFAPDAAAFVRRRSAFWRDATSTRYASCSTAVEAEAPTGETSKHRIAVIPGDGIGKEVVPEGLARARSGRAQVRHRPRTSITSTSPAATTTPSTAR